LKRSSISIAGLILLLVFFITACEDTKTEGTTPPDPTPSGWYSVYFTDPQDAGASSYRGGPDEALAAAIDRARLSVDLAVLELNLWSVRDALIHAQARGLQVRVVTESNNLDFDEIQDLIEAGIPVLGDQREGLMHNKFVVIDRQEVWTGSMNFTTSDGYKNDNNLVRMRSARLAENYTTEFEEMFRDDLFGPDIRAATPHPVLTIEGTQLETYFSPDDQTARRLVELISGARERVCFLAYSFTSDELAEALIRRARAGVEVAGVMDKSQISSNQGTEFERLVAAGLDIRADGNPNKMHNKVFIIDESVVVTGSYNFSASAEKYNDENTIILYNKAIAMQYLAEFQRIFEMAER
jgi:phosphatidylserine/phosphatidylglycerophosphate/cardiolipin synthase-like enzyme